MIDELVKAIASPKDAQAAKAKLVQSLLKEMTEFADGQAAFFYNLRYKGSEDGMLVVTEAQLYGPEEVISPFSTANGTPYGDVEASLEETATFNEFCILGWDDMTKPLQDYYWGPAGVFSSLSINFMDGGRLLGHLSVFRTRGHAPFAEEDLRKVRPLEAKLNGAICGVSAAASRQDEGRRTLLFRRDGTLWMHQEGPESAWVQEDDQTWLREAVCAFAKDPESSGSAQSENAQVSLYAMQNASEDAVLAIVEPLLPMHIPRAATMSRGKMTIMGHAARGLTVEEIAQEISRSPDTVRTHLKQIYEYLGISSRVELANLYVKRWK